MKEKKYKLILSHLSHLSAKTLCTQKKEITVFNDEKKIDCRIDKRKLKKRVTESIHSLVFTYSQTID